MGKLQINGDISLVDQSSRVPTLSWIRQALNDSYTDWRIRAESGNFYIQHQSNTNDWITSFYFNEASQGGTIGTQYSISATGGFVGNLSGNASTATKLQTARTISLTGSVTGSGSFDGSGNLSISTTTNHSHSYLPLSGGNLTGHLYLTKAVSDSSTANTSQIVFGTSSNNHVAISSNTHAIVINPSLNSTTGQIILSTDAASTFTNGVTLLGRSTISYAHTGGGMLQLSSTDNNESSIAYNSGGTQYWVVGKSCGGTDNGTFAWWYNPSGKNMMTLNNSGNLHLAGNTISFSGSMTQNTSPTVVATYVNNNSANGLGFAYTSNLSVGQASYLTNINSTDMASSSSVKRYIWMSYADLVTGRPAYDTNLTFQTSSGTLFTPKLNVGGKVELWTDSEGGNIRITSPNGSWWSIDALSNNVLRFIWAEAQVPFTFSSEGFFTSIRSDMGCLRLTNNGWTGYGYEDPWDAGLTGVEGRVYFKLHR